MNPGEVRGLDLPEVPDWSISALCAQTDPEVWFPAKGESSRPAKQICSRCPVRRDCLEAGLAEPFGIWGGLSSREREALRRELRTTADHARAAVLDRALNQATAAHTPRRFDKHTGQWTDGDTLFLRCTAWRDLAEHVAESLLRGTRVVATGRLRQSNWTTAEGENRTAIELTVDEVGPSLRWATAEVKKTQRQQASPNPAADDPWATSPPPAPAASPASPSPGTAAQPSEPPF